MEAHASASEEASSSFVAINPGQSSLRERTLAQLEEAVRLIDPPRKHAYIQAQRVCPQLVEIESNPINFLVFEKYNFWSAAERLVTYWQLRFEIFGEDQWCLPMDLSGRGALDNEDIVQLKKGLDVVTSDDVIILFHEAITGYEPAKIQLRRAFFMMQQHMHLPTSSREVGIDFISVLDQGFDVLRDGKQVIYDTIRSAFPVRVKAVHRVIFQTSAQTVFRTVLSTPQGSLFSAFSSGRLVKIHRCSSPADAKSKLLSHGILPSTLPPSLGGTLDLHSFLVRFLLSQNLPATQAAFSDVMGVDDRETMRVLSVFLMDNDVHDGRASHDKIRRFQARPLEGSSRDFFDPFKDLSTVGTAEELRRELSKLDEAISLLPESDKIEYLQAQQRCPNLVQLESNPMMILRLEKFDVWRVARKVTNYWKHRVVAFGDKAFLPLTLDGAMYDEDIDVLRCGHLILPGTDKRGRTVVCIDTAQDGYPSMKSRLRCLFYSSSILMQNPNMLEEGFVQFFVFGGKPDNAHARSRKLSSWKPLADKYVMDVSRECFPAAKISTHFIYCSNNFFATLFPWVCNVFAWFLKQDGQFHDGRSIPYLIDKLEKLGISKECQPFRVGGSMDGNAFVCHRAAVEAAVNLSTSTTQRTCSSPLRTVHDPQNDHRKPSAATDIEIMEKALGRIPRQDKTALTEALCQCPDLVAEESGYSNFLQYAEFDAQRAASLLVEYWEKRKLVFGDRAFLRMSQTGDGTLDREDIKYLQSNYLMQLPSDLGGRSVVYCDNSRIHRQLRQSELRCAFYLFSIVAENKTTRNEGYQLLYRGTEDDFDGANAEYMNFVLKCIPVKLRQCHLFSFKSRNGEPAAPLAVSTHALSKQTLKGLLGNLPATSQDFLVEHLCDSHRELTNRLQQYGFCQGGLPKSIGGGWGAEEFSLWQELRIRHEWNLPTSVGTREMAGKLGIPARRRESEVSSSSQQSERRRRMNVVHAWRRRERQKLEAMMLQEQVSELRYENRRLKDEGSQLHELVRQAQEVASCDVVKANTLLAGKART